MHSLVRQRDDRSVCACAFTLDIDVVAEAHKDDRSFLRGVWRLSEHGNSLRTTLLIVIGREQCRGSTDNDISRDIKNNASHSDVITD